MRVTHECTKYIWVRNTRNPAQNLPFVEERFKQISIMAVHVGSRLIVFLSVVSYFFLVLSVVGSFFRPLLLVG